MKPYAQERKLHMDITICHLTINDALMMAIFQEKNPYWHLCCLYWGIASTEVIFLVEILHISIMLL